MTSPAPTSDEIILILAGPPSSGKGTVSDGLRAGGLALKTISTGDMLRAEIQQGTPRGLAAKATMARGELVPDETVIAMVSEYMDANKAAEDGTIGYIFDGFPRSIEQAVALHKLLSSRGIDMQNNVHVARLDVDEKNLWARMNERWQGAVDAGEIPRIDDGDVEKFKTRLHAYASVTAPQLISYYGADMRVVDGNGTKEETLARVCAAFGMPRGAGNPAQAAPAEAKLDRS